jgi:gliding motility-associated-like protein
MPPGQHIQPLRVRSGLLMLLILSLAALQAQEICDNGLDDNGNGLIDLQDPACACPGITVTEDLTALIPNPSFENFGCCPTYWSQLDCATGWVNLNQASPDFHHGCGFIGGPILDAGIFPFPDGLGAGGSIFSHGWKEYMATCLNQPLQAGKTYQFRMQVASVPIAGNGDVCNGGSIYYGPVAIKLFGNAQCGNLALPTLDCPSSLDLSWIEIGTVTYTPATDWSEVTMTLTPGFNVAALMLGPPCVLPPEYGSGAPCYPYFLFDDLQLEAETPAPPLTLSVSGHPCTNDLVLTAVEGIPDGTWQWYFQGVALSGETGPTLLLPQSAYQPGVYTVRYLLHGECQTAELTLNFVLPEPSLEEHFLCPGDTARCAGQFFWQPGVQEVVLPSWLGCDSVVQCVILHHPASPPQNLILRRCGPDTLLVCGDTLSQSGLYQRTCTNIWGCDSRVRVDLSLLTPQARIRADSLSTCDTLFSILLDGTLSSRNTHPQGLTRYGWTGPPGGLSGPDTDSTALATRTGTYCLILTHEVDSFACADTVCITLAPDAAPPEAPLLAAPPPVCLAPGAVADLTFILPDSLSELYWNADPALALSGQSDSTLHFSASAPGQYPVCLWASNTCGSSDTLCRILEFLPAPLTLEQRLTCDPAAAGTDTLQLQTQAGCDSTVIVETLYQAAFETLQSVLICGPGTDYRDTLAVGGGPCDSLFITQYRFYLPDTTHLQGSSCDPVQAGQFVQVFQGALGCDSTVITTVSLLPTDTILVEGITCFRDQEEFSTQVLSNQIGCDSVVLTAIWFIGRDTTLVARSSCDSSQVGIFIHTHPIAGTPCDSVVVETVTWAAQSLTEQTLISCEPDGPATDTLRLTGSSGCDSLVIRRFQYSDLQAQVQTEPESCAGYADGRILIGNILGGQPPYRYRLGGGAWQSQPDFEGLPPGSYTLTVEDAEGCTRQYPGLLVGAGMVVSVDIGPDREVEAGAMVTLSAQSGQVLSQWQWSAADPLSCPGCTQTQVGPVTGEQTVTLLAYSPAGCMGSDAMRITLRQVVPDPPQVYIPNGFSPNGDGINDLFRIYGNERVRMVRRLAVYDRWGNALYEELQLPLNAPGTGWDGSFRGRPMDPGVYVYVAEVELDDGRLRLYKGDITLLR